MSYKCAKFIRRNKWTCNWNYFFWLYYINQLYEFNYNFLTNIILINLFVIFINIYKGDHFLGDAGSLMLSSFIAILIIWLHNKNISHPASGASAEIILIIFILPVIDMLRLIFERLLKKILLTVIINISIII